jgi:hypothetical protein
MNIINDLELKPNLVLLEPIVVLCLIEVLWLLPQDSQWLEEHLQYFVINPNNNNGASFNLLHIPLVFLWVFHLVIINKLKQFIYTNI